MDHINETRDSAELLEAKPDKKTKPPLTPRKVVLSVVQAIGLTGGIALGISREARTAVIDKVLVTQSLSAGQVEEIARFCHDSTPGAAQYQAPLGDYFQNLDSSCREYQEALKTNNIPMGDIASRKVFSNVGDIVCAVGADPENGIKDPTVKAKLIGACTLMRESADENAVYDTLKLGDVYDIGLTNLSGEIDPAPDTG